MGEKKVEHIELFYDLIFVFCISKLTAFLEPMTERFDDQYVLPVLHGGRHPGGLDQ